MWHGNTGIVPKGGCPCRDCDKQGCGIYHDECPEYQKYREQIDAIHKRYIVEREKDSRSPKRKGETSPFAITRTHKRRSGE